MSLERRGTRRVTDHEESHLTSESTKAVLLAWNPQAKKLKIASVWVFSLVSTLLPGCLRKRPYNQLEKEQKKEQRHKLSCFLLLSAEEAAKNPAR